MISMMSSISLTAPTHARTHAPIPHSQYSGGRDVLQAAFAEGEKSIPIACLADVVALEESGEIKLGGARF